MAGIIARLISWLAGKVVIYVVILGLLLAVFLVAAVPPMVTSYHERELEKAISQLSESKALVGELAERAEGLTAGIQERTEELRELEKKRQEMEKWLEKVLNVFRKKEVEAEKGRIEAEQKRLSDEIKAAVGERDQIRAEGGESEEELKRRELLRDEKERQLREITAMRQALDSLMRNELRALAFKALVILGALILVPVLWKVVAFYVIAPLAHSARPILLGVDDVGGRDITATLSHPAQRLTLADGEVLMTKVDYLQGSMGNFGKKTRWLIDWRYPFSSLAAGLYLLTRIENAGEEPGQVTLSSQENATEELAVVEVPEGKSLVFRPHYLVAVSHPLDRPPRIRSRWVFGRVHAWINLRFRYLMMEGPARLVFSAQRGIQVEVVSPDQPGRRVNSNLTAAFSPHLSHLPRRVETFVAYLRGKNGLFDDFFQGSGWVIQQQVSAGKKHPAARVWDTVFGAVGKVFGI